jgi:acyl-CoA thioesterase II
MHIRDHLGLEATGGPCRWRLAVGPTVLTQSGAIHGGAALAAAIEAMQAAARQPLIWATAQYLRHAGPASVIDIEVATEVAGRQTTQARATLRVGDTEVLTANGALGARSFPHMGRWVDPPTVPPPDASPPREVAAPVNGTLLETCEVRVASGRQTSQLDGRPGSGRSAIWCRLPGGTRPLSAGDLALMGDFVMLGFADALGVPCAGTSLDNTVRVATLVPAEWVLVDIQIQVATGGFGHADARLWTGDGALLGLASQTLALRAVDAEGRPVRQTRRIVGG